MEQKKNEEKRIPEWAEGALFYQLFVDRFARSKNHLNDLINGRNFRTLS